MAWKPLAQRLDDLPLIIAGPILRQVTHNKVTVWVVLKKRAKVTLTIHDSKDNRKVGDGNRPTIAVGQNLHIVAVTARTEKLLEGRIYLYDLRFDGETSLIQAMTPKKEKPEAIAYDPFTLPSFALPPADLNKVRLIQGSCRKPHGGTKDKPEYKEWPDALSMLDDQIAEKAAKPEERPHQLFLTGDQIYADEVADVLLKALTDAGDKLLGA